MITKTTEEARHEWGDLTKAVTASVGREHVEITRTRGRPKHRAQAADLVAVLVSIDWYDALPEEQRPEESRTLAMKSSEARDRLREVVESAIRGVHTKITLYGRPMAVVVPAGWYDTSGGPRGRRPLAPEATQAGGE
jgi:antitoxin (DNA-binding transcriptional repressor) of toxin-antitoxin stability system